MFAFAQPVKAMLLEAADPALDRSRVFAKLAPDFGAGFPVCDQQYTVQSMVVAGLVRPPDLPLNRNPHHVRVLNLQFAHRHLPNTGWRFDNLFMRQY